MTQDDEAFGPRNKSDLLVISKQLDKEKSWYDQTVEEEENHAQEAPLEARFSNAIHIGELPSANPRSDG